MLPRKARFFLGLIGTLLLSTFIIGLAHSISTGFAGFWGGLPFSVITVLVLSMAWYDFYDQCVRQTDDEKKTST